MSSAVDEKATGEIRSNPSVSSTSDPLELRPKRAYRNAGLLGLPTADTGSCPADPVTVHLDRAGSPPSIGTLTCQRLRPCSGGLGSWWSALLSALMYGHGPMTPESLVAEAFTLSQSPSHLRSNRRDYGTAHSAVEPGTTESLRFTTPINRALYILTFPQFLQIRTIRGTEDDIELSIKLNTFDSICHLL